MIILLVIPLRFLLRLTCLNYSLVSRSVVEREEDVEPPMLLIITIILLTLSLWMWKRKKKRWWLKSRKPKISIFGNNNKLFAAEAHPDDHIPHQLSRKESTSGKPRAASNKTWYRSRTHISRRATHVKLNFLRIRWADSHPWFPYRKPLLFKLN